MLIHIDGGDSAGGKSLQFHNDARIVIDPQPEYEFPFGIQVVLTSEGIVIDVTDEEGVVVATSAEMYQDAAIRLLERHGVI